jgi:GPN-loop GTPase
MEQVGELNQDDYVLFDCPGQIELYAHLDIMTRVINHLNMAGFSLVSVYIIDSTFILDEFKFISGALVFEFFVIR